MSVEIAYDNQKTMSSNEANEVLFPNIKKMSVEEGFLIYKRFLDRPIECSTTLNVEGYPPRHIHGFRLWVNNKDTGESIDVNDEMLMESYMLKLTGENRGDYS